MKLDPNLTIHSRIILPVYLAIVATVLFPKAACADGGIVMIMLVWPASWLLLLVVIPVEALVARKVLGLSLARASKLSTVANLFSSIIGIPVTGVLLIALLVANGGHGIDTHLSATWRTIFQGVQDSIGVAGSPTPEMNSLRSSALYIPAFLLSLLTPYYFSTVWIEGLVAQRFTNDKINSFRWSWIANSVSYGLILGLLLGGLWWTYGRR